MLRTVVDAATTPGPQVPGWLAQPRMLAAVALTVAYLARRPDDVEVWWPVGLILVCLAAEDVARRLLPRPQAVHLPGYTDPTAPVVRYIVPASGVALGLLAAAALAAWSPVVVAAGAALQAVVLAAAGLQLMRAYAGRSARAAAVRSALVAYAPEFVLYTARRGGAYQLDMWLPHLRALGRRFVVVTRDPQALASLGEAQDVPVVACPAWRDLDNVVVPSLRAAFYVNSVAANADFVTYRQLTHVYLGHGESDKALSHHPAHAMYDLVFVSGAAAVERYARHGVQVPADKFVVVGSPQSATVQQALRPVAELESPTILYAPTWQGYNDDSSYSSLRHGATLVASLLRRPGAVVFRPHPFSRSRAGEADLVKAVEQLLADDARLTGRAHVWGVDEPFAQSANRADAMVADLSSVVTEFLASDKPLAIVDDGDAQTFRERNPVAHAAYLIASDLGNVEEVLRDLLGEDPLREVRREVRARYVGAEGARAFPEAVLAVLDGPDHNVGTPSTTG
jgi:hypothetical protein